MDIKESGVKYIDRYIHFGYSCFIFSILVSMTGQNKETKLDIECDATKVPVSRNCKLYKIQVDMNKNCLTRLGRRRSLLGTSQIH